MYRPAVICLGLLQLGLSPNQAHSQISAVAGESSPAKNHSASITTEQTEGGTSEPKGAPAGEFGYFEGEVEAVWLDDHRHMKLKANFAYIDARGKRWLAPTHSLIDGASIPRPLWSFFGSPFEGAYRKASVVHDVACDQMKESWEDVHRMFYEACRCGGVGERKAKLMYWAVYHFGPRWMKGVSFAPHYWKSQNGDQTGTVQFIPDPPSEETLKAAEAYFESHDPSLEEIPTLDVRDK